MRDAPAESRCSWPRSGSVAEHGAAGRVRGEPVRRRRRRIRRPAGPTAGGRRRGCGVHRDRHHRGLPGRHRHAPTRTSGADVVRRAAGGRRHLGGAGRAPEGPNSPTLVDDHVAVGDDVVEFLRRTRTSSARPRCKECEPMSVLRAVFADSAAARHRRPAADAATPVADRDRSAEPWLVAGRHCGATGLHRRRPGGAGRAGHLSGCAAVPAWAVPDDVHDAAVDDPAVRRVLHRAGVERVLPAESRRRAEGAVGGVRPADPPRVRLGPSAGGR